MLYKTAFISRWYFWYNLELAALHSTLSKGTPLWTSRERAEEALALDRRRQETQRSIFRHISGYGSVCAACGACCKEKVDRYTGFDAAVRSGGPMPLRHYGRDILSLPWMVKNGIAHTWQRAVHAAQRRPLPPAEVCENLGQAGCTLAHEDRPMLCASWFCPKYLRHMKVDDLRGLAPKLREMEKLHFEAARLMRRNRRG